MRANLPESDDVEVQMAPLIDCVFLLLIFFLVATTLKKIEVEVPLELPEATFAANKVTQEEGMLTVSIDAQGQLYLDAQAVSVGFLHEQIKQRASDDASQPVRINADRQAPWASVLQVLELLKFEGLTDVRPGTDNPAP